MANRVKSFKWTDERVLEFHKMSTTEVYGVFNGLRTLKEKLKKYKEIKREGEAKIQASIALLRLPVKM